MPNFKDLLNKPLDDVKRPPVQPAGTWYGSITGYEVKESRFQNEDGSKDAQVSFKIKLSGAEDSIDAEAAKPFLGRTVTQEFSIEDGKEWPLKMFLEALGIGTEGKSLAVAIPEANNAQVQLVIEHSISKKDPEVTFANVKRVSARQ